MVIIPEANRTLALFSMEKWDSWGFEAMSASHN